MATVTFDFHPCGVIGGVVDLDDGLVKLPKEVKAVDLITPGLVEAEKGKTQALVTNDGKRVVVFDKTIMGM